MRIMSFTKNEKEAPFIFIDINKFNDDEINLNCLLYFQLLNGIFLFDLRLSYQR